jgi:hypothetical protein
MRVACGVSAAVVFLLLLGGGPRAAGPTDQAEKPRNPFGVPDVADPDGADVQAFAAKVKLPGGPKDPNAAQWVKEETAGKKGSLEGEWSGRWNFTGGKSWAYGRGAARVKVVGDRVYILFKDNQGEFLIDTRREKNRLVGRFRRLDGPGHAPCVFLVVDDERLDGDWNGQGRWDFRRKLK